MSFIYSCSAIKLSTEPTSTNLPDILKIKRRLASFRAKDDKACRTTTFHLWKTSFVQSDAANDDFSLAKFHRSRRWLAATKSRTIFSSLSSVWINLSTYKIKWQFWFCHRASRSKTYFKVPGWCIWHKQMCYLSARKNNAYEEQRSKIKRTLKVLLRSKFNVKFVTKTLSFQLIRSGCTCFGHWSELWRPLSENIEIENDLCSSDKAIVLWLWRHFLNTQRKQYVCINISSNTWNGYTAENQEERLFQRDSIPIFVSHTVKTRKLRLLYFQNETCCGTGNLYKDLFFVYLQPSVNNNS